MKRLNSILKNYFLKTFLFCLAFFFAFSLNTHAISYSDGTLDNTFTSGTGFVTNTTVNAVVLDSNGKILVGGDFTKYNSSTANVARIIRLNSDGTVDNYFGGASGGFTGGIVKAIAIDSNQKILVGGTFTAYQGTSTNGIIRLNNDGTIDTSFIYGTGFNVATGGVNAIAIEGDGNILIGGAFTTYQGTTTSQIIRVSATGTLDTTFSVRAGAVGSTVSVYAIAIQPYDNKIIVGGPWSTSFNGSTMKRIIRLNTNGAPDTSLTYNANAGFGNAVNSLLIIPNNSDHSLDKILVGGAFTTNYFISSTSSFPIPKSIAVLNRDFTVDNTFSNGGGFGGAVNSLAIQSDGKIIAGGAFTNYVYNSATTTSTRLARLTSTGAFDSTFIVPGTGLNNVVNGIVMQSVNNIEKPITVGVFSQYNGASAVGIARFTNSASTFTLSGPSSGSVNASSSNFTVTPNGAYTGTITISLSGGGLSGTTVLTFSNSAAPQTFTITPTVAGTVTLIPTNNQSLSNPSTLTYTAVSGPGAPTSVSATPGDTQATVTFSAPSSDGGSAITGYTVTSSPAGGTDSNAGSTSLTHTITGLTNGTSYTFTVTATNAVGTSSASSASGAVTPKTTPGAPTSLNATIGDSQVSLSWSAPSSNGGSAITDYFIEYKLTATSTWSIFSHSVSSATTTTITGLSNGSSYDFRVSAINVAGTSTASNIATGTPNPIPASTFSFSGPSSGTVNASSSNFTVTPNGAYTGTITITPSGGGLSTPIVLTFSNSATPQTFTIVPTVAGTVTLTPTNNGGLSNPSDLTYTAVSAPGAPTSVAAIPGDTQATVTFVAPVSNGGSAITGYTVTSSPAGGTDSDAGSTALTHTITGLTNGTSYTFTVTATNVVGTSSASSASNSITPSNVTYYTLSGPSSGSVNTSSSNFTVTPNGTYTGTVTITPSGGGLSSPIVLTFSNSAAPQTFTITPTVAGVVTLIGSNNQSLTDPANLTYYSISGNVSISTSTAPVLASNGKTITATIVGGIGSNYLPSSNVTGITITTTTSATGGATYPIASTTISGATLTITLEAPIASGETLILSLATSSNLTDSNNDPVASTSNISIINNSTQIVTRYGMADSSISYYGRMGTGVVRRLFSAVDTESVFVVNGTSATARVQVVLATTFSVSVDGGAFVTKTLPILSAPAALTLFDDLSPGDHTVSIKTSTTAGNGLYSNFIQVFGGTGAIRQVGESDGIGYGTTTIVVGSAGFTSVGSLNGMNNYINDGMTSPNAKTSEDTVSGQGYFFYDDGIRFGAKTNKIKLWVKQNGALLAYSIDGVKQGTLTLPNNNGKWGWVTALSGLDVNTNHTYGFTLAYEGASGPSHYGFNVDQIMLFGSGAQFTNAASLQNLGGYGDSITAGIKLFDSSISWLYHVAQNTNMIPYNRGISGDRVAVGCPTSCVGGASAARIGGITTISPEPTKATILYGTNDIGYEHIIYSTTDWGPTSLFGSSYRNMLTNLLASTTNTRFYILKILPRTGSVYYTASTTSRFNGSGDGISGNVATVLAAHPEWASRIVLLNNDTWKLNGVDGTDWTTNYADTVHPNQAGMDLIANRMTPLIAATGFTVSGPSSGTSGSTSANFTVTIASGSTFTGDQTVTISDGGNSGTITASTGTTGSNSINVIPTNGSTSFTFTYTPASSGVKTISFTNDQQWDNPSSLSYTSSAALATPSAPTSVSATPGDTQATVTFSAPSSDGGSAITGYTVTSSPAGGTDSNAGSTSLTHTITGLTNGTSYTFTVTATNAVGTSSPSSASNSVTPTATITPPGQVGTVTASNVSTSTLTLSWSGPSSGSTPTGYLLFNATLGSTTTLGNVSTTNISGLTPNTSYTFNLYAFNTAGTSSSPSSLSTTTLILQTAPSAPTSVSATPGDTQATVTFSAPSSDGGSAITGYTVTSSPAGGTDSNAGSTSLTHTITGLTNGTSYTFTVTATNAVGTSSASSASGAVTPISESEILNPHSPVKTHAINAAPPILPAAAAIAIQNFIFNQTLQIRTVNDDVRRLQTFLNGNGFPVAPYGPGSKGKETNLFGYATRNAIIKFQKANKIIPANGIFGPKTRAAVNKKISNKK